MESPCFIQIPEMNNERGPGSTSEKQNHYKFIEAVVAIIM